MQEERQRNKDKTGGGPAIGSLPLPLAPGLALGGGGGGGAGGDCASESGGPSSAGGGSGGSGGAAAGVAGAGGGVSGAAATASAGALVPPLELVSIESLERAERLALTLPDQLAAPSRRVGFEVHDYSLCLSALFS